MTDWIWPPTHKPFTEYVGFVYIIRNTINDKYYIGQKKFWSDSTLKPLKGKKQSRHKRIESKWKDYYGSSKELLGDIERHGKGAFSRKILFLCKSKAQMNYLETELQFKHHVLFDSNSYNKIVNCRISWNQLKNVEWN